MHLGMRVMGEQPAEVQSSILLTITLSATRQMFSAKQSRAQTEKLVESAVVNKYLSGTVIETGITAS